MNETFFQIFFLAKSKQQYKYIKKIDLNLAFLTSAFDTKACLAIALTPKPFFHIISEILQSFAFQSE